MSEVIQCPQCDKRFRLPDNPPATFACTNCQTLMDLSDFGGAEPVAAVPSAPAAPAPAPGAAPGPSRHRARGRGGARRRGGRAAARRGGGARGARGGRGRGPAPDDDYDDGGYRGRGRPKSNNGLIFGVIGIVALAVIVIVVMSNKKGAEDVEAELARGGSSAGDPAAGTPGATPGTPAAGGTSGAAPGSGAVGTPGEPVAPGGTGDAGGADPAAAAPKPHRSRRVPLRNVTLKKFDWPDEVDEATRTKADEAVASLLRGAREGVEAADWLVEQGRPICGRLISEFKNIEASPGLDSREGKSRLRAIESVLRRIDGWIERKFKEEKHIQHVSTESFVMGQLKRWTYWWESDTWKTQPREPWDPHVDDWDDPERKGKKKKEDEEKAKKGGYDKPVGR